MKPATECRVEWCRRERQRDALYCPVHLNDAWALREPVVPAWRRWTMEHNAGKDLTGRAA